MQTLIIFSNSHWSALNPIEQATHERLTKHVQVLYINMPLTNVYFEENIQQAYTQQVQEVLAGEQVPLQVVTPNLWVLIPPVVLDCPLTINSKCLVELREHRSYKKCMQLVKHFLKSNKKSSYYYCMDNQVDFIEAELQQLGSIEETHANLFQTQVA
jgi:hypothetical protein